MLKAKWIVALAALAALQGCGTMPGNTSRSTRNEQVRYLLSQAEALEREEAANKELAKKQREAAKALKKQAKEAARQRWKFLLTKGDEADLRAAAADHQCGWYEQQAREAKHLANQLDFEAKKCRVEAKRARREAWRIEKFTPDPIYEPEELPKYGAK